MYCEKKQSLKALSLSARNRRPVPTFERRALERHSSIKKIVSDFKACDWSTSESKSKLRV
jgi:hypothetical protein